MFSDAEQVRETGQIRWLKRLYGTPSGRFILNAVISRKWFTSMCTLPIRSRWSRNRIQPFIRDNRIDMSSYESGPFRSFNDFFIRRIKPGSRPYSLAPEDVISPCDGRLSAVRIAPDTSFSIKGQPYTVASLLRDDQAAKEYEEGTALIFRLQVHDYHRYLFSDSGQASSPREIPGRYHTVHPMGLSATSVLQENARTWQILHFDHLGDIIQIEVGAMMVGRIVNHPIHSFRRGDEKGYFCFGGSTIVWLVKHGQIALSDAWSAAYERELPVLQGQTIGTIGVKRP